MILNVIIPSIPYTNHSIKPNINNIGFLQRI